MPLVFVARYMNVSVKVGFGLCEFDFLAVFLLAASLLSCGGVLGWALRATVRRNSVQNRSQDADINWLKAALAESEQRSAQLSEWLNVMEEELTLLRAEGESTVMPKKAPQSNKTR